MRDVRRRLAAGALLALLPLPALAQGCRLGFYEEAVGRGGEERRAGITAEFALIPDRLR